MKDVEEVLPFEIISKAGESKSFSMLAIDEARKKNYQQALAYMEKAEIRLRQAHQIQFGLLQEEAKGNRNEVSVVLVHAQDHLTMALIEQEHAKEFYEVYKRIDHIETILKARNEL